MHAINGYTPVSVDWWSCVQVRDLGKHLDLRLATLVGGDSMEAQFAELAGNPDAVVATPGRLAHHLAEIAGFTLAATEYIVFDEADRRAPASSFVYLLPSTCTMHTAAFYG